MPTFDALLLGGGSGSRYESDSDLPKQFTLLGDVPVLVHCVRAFVELGARRIVLVVPVDHIERTEQLVQTAVETANTEIRVIAGGKTRTESSRLGLLSLSAQGQPPKRVLIHDLCRPYLAPQFRKRILETLEDTRFSAWIPTIPVTETLKRVSGQRVEAPVDRTGVVRVQTPQIFDFAKILRFTQKVDPNLAFTDDASLCEFFGEAVGVFPGDGDNVKLTFSSDRQALETSLTEAACESESAGTYTV